MLGLHGGVGSRGRGACHRGALATRGGSGRGDRAGGLSSLALAWAHSGIAAHEFFVGLLDPPGAWLPLPDLFLQAMVECKPQGLWLRVEGRPHGSAWVATTFGGDGAMYLVQGWQMFVRWRNIQQSQCLMFRYDG